MITPGRLPDQCTADNDGQAAGEQHIDAGIGNTRGDVPTQWDENDANTTEWELKKNTVKSVIAKGAHYKRAKS